MNQPAPPPAPAKGLIARAIGIIVSPRATFEDVVRAPRAVGILFLCCLVIGISQAAPQFTERGRQAALDMQVQQTERMMGRQLTDEMYQGMERRSHFGGYITLVGVFVGMPIWSLILTAIFWAIFNALMGGTATFKHVLAVVTHSQVIAAVGAAVSAPIQLMQGTMSVGGPFNLGALVPMFAETSFVARFLGTVSVFTLWGLFVLAIGLAVLYKRKTTNIAIALIAVYALISAAVIAAFGGLGR
jgi:hypothetical protein